MVPTPRPHQVALLVESVRHKTETSISYYYFVGGGLCILFVIIAVVAFVSSKRRQKILSKPRAAGSRAEGLEEEGEEYEEASQVQGNYAAFWL